MKTELVSFKVDAEVRARAARVCAELGLELHEILRLLITQIARDGALPFAVGSRKALPVEESPSALTRHPRLWGELKAQVDADLATTLLVRFIAEASVRLEDAADSADAKAPDPALIEALTAQRAAAIEQRRTLDVTDAEALARIVVDYAARLRAWR